MINEPDYDNEIDFKNNDVVFEYSPFSKNLAFNFKIKLNWRGFCKKHSETISKDIRRINNLSKPIFIHKCKTVDKRSV